MKSRQPGSQQWQPPADNAATRMSASNWQDLVTYYLKDILATLYDMSDRMSAMDDEITTLKSDVAAERTAVDSAKALIEGFATQLQAAVQAAQAAGATPQQLQDLNDLHAAVTQQTQDLATAVASQSPPQSPAAGP